ncbi:NAD(P)H-dependent oxidoreductase [uncultured Halopseudomonas sp.]|uniref:flavodoxin family protein n=1 Tax=uncultured Halopseudomonas sp. TaxID=2901193 RepID=UPI0030EF14D6|tara:strand:+ start:46391 stop:46858 length:468 start_codon:yes stop_codon:yes gene_type:complete
MTDKTLLIVAHAPSDNTRRLVESVITGARHAAGDSVEVIYKPPLEARPSDVLGAQAIILGTPENLAYMSGALKDFFDRCYYPVLEEKQGMPCAAFIRAGQDGTGTRRAIQSIVTGLRWSWVQEPVVLKGQWDDAFLEQTEELGKFMAAALDAGII